jgi:peptide/nickel transport system substrate-binding protein
MNTRGLSGRSFYMVLALVLLAALFLSACSSNTTSTVPPATTSKTASPTKTTVAAPTPGGTLTIGMNRDAVFLGDPIELTQQQDTVMSRPAVETLARYDSSGKLTPVLATSWEMNPTALTMTITLRKGVKFHDGTDFNATAVKFNLERFTASKRSELTQVKSVEVVDDYTVRLNLKTWDNTIDGAALYYAGNMISPLAFQTNGKAWIEKNPVGTGPFKFVSWERDVSLVYQKNTNYWQAGKPYLDKIQFKVIADPMVSLAALERREIDILEFTESKDLATLKATGKYTINKQETSLQGFYTMIPDSAHADSPFSNLKVRQAIYACLDRQAMVDTILSGQGTVATQYADPTGWAYNPAIKATAYDVNKAKALLAEAGYPNGFKCSIYGKNNAQDTQMEAAIQGYFSKIGITADVQGLSDTMFNDISGTKGWTNAVNLIGLRGGPDPAALIPKYYGPAGKPAWQISTIHPADALQGMIDAIAAPTFEAKQKATFIVQASLFDQNLVSIPMYIPSRSLVKYSNVKDENMYQADLSVWTPESAWISK